MACRDHSRYLRMVVGGFLPIDIGMHCGMHCIFDDCGIADFNVFTRSVIFEVDLESFLVYLQDACKSTSVFGVEAGYLNPISDCEEVCDLHDDRVLAKMR